MRAPLRLCACAHPCRRITTQPHSGWQGTGLIRHHVNGVKMQTVKYILCPCVFCPLEWFLDTESHSKVTFEFLLILKILKVLKLTNPNPLRIKVQCTNLYEHIFTIVFKGGFTNYTQCFKLHLEVFNDFFFF